MAGMLSQILTLTRAKFRNRSPRGVALPSSPEPSVSMSISITTPESQIPSIHSQLATIVSEPPHEILTHDVNKLLSYLHDTNAACDAQYEELIDPHSTCDSL